VIGDGDSERARDARLGASGRLLFRTSRCWLRPVDDDGDEDRARGTLLSALVSWCEVNSLVTTIRAWAWSWQKVVGTVAVAVPVSVIMTAVGVAVTTGKVTIIVATVEFGAHDEH
jgi:hypothetical protein